MKTIAFGMSVNFYSYIERLDSFIHIDCFSDNDPGKMGKHWMGDDRVCIAPDEISSLDDPYVIILAEKDSSIKAIEAQLDSYGVKHDRVETVLSRNDYQVSGVRWPQTIQNNRIHKFIELLVHGTTECNFHCEYCYVWRKEDFHKGLIASDYSAKEIRKALSRKRLGGICHINLCALGETLIAKNIEDIIYELADEGHFLSIITNGTVTVKINKILSFPDSIKERIFFKFSFHYEELMRTGLMNAFWKNVKEVRNSPCSYTIEITPSDHLLDKADAIKDEFVRNEDGAMPHITFTRDATKEGLDLYSDLSLEEYVGFWKQFDSELFDLKTRLYKRHISENCYAGAWSYRINLVNGNLQSCYAQELKGSVFEDVDKPFPFLTVKHDCAMDYCFNNHAFISWGDVPEIECERYLALRDRKLPDGRTWIKQPYRYIMSQKLYENNFEYLDKWPDYEKLFAPDRKAAFVMFNSPEYGNLGDQAIALAEREFFVKNFPDKDFIEIPCNAYIKENLLIKDSIRKDDVILLTGGGYLGSLWKWLEDISLNIIENYPENKIVILPQTIFFSEDAVGNHEKKLFINIVSKHKNITIFARDTKTAKLLNEMGIKNVFTVPDMAMSLDLSDYKAEIVPKKAVVCIRNDQESKQIAGAQQSSNDLISKGFDVRTLSTTIDANVDQCNRKHTLEELWKEISNSEIVITDRLHMVIFCCLLGVHCIAFDNGTGKVFDFIDSWKAGGIVDKADSLSDIDKYIKSTGSGVSALILDNKYTDLISVIERGTV